MKKSNPNYAKAIKTYCDAMAEKKGHTQAMKASGIGNHAQAGLAWYADSRNPKGVRPGSEDISGLSEEAAAVRVAELRAGGLSWGYIMVACGKPLPLGEGALTEGRVRGLFGKATGLAAEGTRVGRGGRFLNNQPKFYRANRKGFGVEDAKPRSLNPDEVARTADKAKSKLPTKVAAAKKRVGKAASAE